METRKEKKSPIIRRGGDPGGRPRGVEHYLIVCLNEATLVVARCGDLRPRPPLRDQTPLPPKNDTCLEDIYRTSSQ